MRSIRMEIDSIQAEVLAVSEQGVLLLAGSTAYNACSFGVARRVLRAISCFVLLRVSRDRAVSGVTSGSADS